MTDKPTIEGLLAGSDRESGRYAWEGTFADYLRMVVRDPSVSRLSHKLVYDAILAKGTEEAPTGGPVYTLFEDEIFGLDAVLENVVHYFASSARRLEIRKRILLLVGPPASGKSSIVALIKRAVEDFTRTDQGATYAIRGCPMQEEPLHLVPRALRPELSEHYGVHVEGDLCPRCRYLLRAKHGGKVSDVPVTRVTFSEYEAVGIGYYLSNNPNPTDASLLVGSVDTGQLGGDRLSVAGKAFRLDGELNVANRGVMEMVEIFKADKHLLTTLLSLAQEQLIKMDRFGSVYADEVIVGHSNEGDFDEFKADRSAEALKDRIIELRIPYNLTVGEEVKIYDKMVTGTELENVHLAPLTLPSLSVFAVLSRLEPPGRQGMTLLDKLRLYDGIKVPRYSLDEVPAMRRHSKDEGMSGVSPRYVMNRLSAVASTPDVRCITPLNALDSLWKGLGESIGLADTDEGLVRYIELFKNTVEEYGNRAVADVQRAFKEGFDASGTDLLSEYLSQLSRHVDGRDASEREMREMEKQVGVVDRGREEFRRRIHGFFTSLKDRGIEYDHKTEPRLRAAIEARLFPTRREVARVLTRPRFARQRVEWRRERNAIFGRLVDSYGYCPICAKDVMEFVLHVLRARPVVKSLKNEGISWEWELQPSEPTDDDAE